MSAIVLVFHDFRLLIIRLFAFCFEIWIQFIIVINKEGSFKHFALIISAEYNCNVLLIKAIFLKMEIESRKSFIRKRIPNGSSICLFIVEKSEFHVMCSIFKTPHVKRHIKMTLICVYFSLEQNKKIVYHFFVKSKHKANKQQRKKNT